MKNDISIDVLNISENTERLIREIKTISKDLKVKYFIDESHYTVGNVLKKLNKIDMEYEFEVIFGCHRPSEEDILHELLHLKRYILNEDVPLFLIYDSNYFTHFVTEFSTIFSHMHIYRELIAVKALNVDEKWDEFVAHVDPRNLFENISLLSNLINMKRNLLFKYKRILIDKIPNEFRIVNNVMKENSLNINSNTIDIIYINNQVKTIKNLNFLQLSQ